jgi:hypothetical protein
LSEASWPAWADGCATGPRTRSRHVCDFSSASSPVCAGSAADALGALAPCHGSDLLPLRLPFAHRPAVPFVASPAFRKFFSKPASLAALPGPNAPFVPPFGVFPWANPWAGPPESSAPCWLTVATSYPLGNCLSREPETSPRYFTRLRTASHRPLPRSSYLASLTARERRQRSW